VDWADAEHAVWVEDEEGQRVSAGMVAHSAVGFSEWGRQLDEWRAQGIVLWAAIERPEGRVVDVLLDHGGRVDPVNPKALDRAGGGIGSARGGRRTIGLMPGCWRAFCGRIMPT